MRLPTVSGCEEWLMPGGSPIPTIPYETPTRRWWLRPAVVWSAVSLLSVVACLPLSVGITAILHYAMRGPFPAVDAEQYSEWAGFALAGLISAGGCVAGILARRALKSQAQPRFVGGAASGGVWLNLFLLAVVVLIILVLGGKW
jgi:hypothetical protein